MTDFQPNSERKSVREQVEMLLPNWQAWYPSLFDAACDLGLLRARVCDLSSLVLSQRHAGIQGEALQAFREKWSMEEPDETAESAQAQSAAKRRPPHKHSAQRR